MQTDCFIEAATNEVPPDGFGIDLFAYYYGKEVPSRIIGQVFQDEQRTPELAPLPLHARHAIRSPQFVFLW